MPSLVHTLTRDPEIAALFSDDAELAAILEFEVALADAEADAGLISPAAAAAIRRAAAGFTPDRAGLVEGLASDGVVVPALIGQLRAELGPEDAKALHFGATSQDAIDTGLILRLGKAIPILIERLTALEKALIALGETSGAMPIMAHTRMQAALPFTVRDKLATWTEPLARLRATLDAMRRRLLVVQLGGPTGDRSSFMGKGDEVARRLAALLDLGLASAWHSQRDPIVEFGALMALISGTLGKFGADVALMAQSEVKQVTLTGGGRSSSMAHKSNPVKAELLVALARYNAGLAGTLQQAMIHENERSGAAWTLEWMVLPDMVMTTGKALALGLALVGQMEFAQPR